MNSINTKDNCPPHSSQHFSVALKNMVWIVVATSALLSLASSYAHAWFDAEKAEKYIRKYEHITEKLKVKYVTVKVKYPKDTPLRAPDAKKFIDEGIINFYYRVPHFYNSEAKRKYRVMVYFGYPNLTGESHIAGNHINFNDWADTNDIFIISFSGHNISDWYEPQKWSGKALISALELLGKMYNIKTNKLLFYGFSGGSQASNLFAAWAPKRTIAFVAQGCGVFPKKPKPNMRTVPGLVTCGDADIVRYIISRRFVRKSRDVGVNVIFKSFPNEDHTVSDKSVNLAKTFMLYHHEKNIDDLGIEKIEKSGEEKISFVGDDIDGVYYKEGALELNFISPVDKVYLPNKKIADAWGEPAPTSMLLIKDD